MRTEVAVTVTDKMEHVSLEVEMYEHNSDCFMVFYRPTYCESITSLFHVRINHCAIEQVSARHFRLTTDDAEGCRMAIEFKRSDDAEKWSHIFEEHAKLLNVQARFSPATSPSSPTVSKSFAKLACRTSLLANLDTIKESGDVDTEPN